VKQSLLWLSIPFRVPYRTSAGTIPARELLVLEAEDGDGVRGWGEAAPLESYDGTSIEHVAAALRGEGSDPYAAAAREMAALDLAGRKSGRPVAEPGRATVPVNLTLPAGPIPDVAAAAAAGAAAGFDCFKVKVGFDDDVDRVAAVRDAIGAHGLIRLDANGAWEPEYAIEHIERLSPLGIELVEQPCRTLAELAEVRFASGVPIAADESVRTAADVVAAAELAACDLVCVKLASAGGISASRAAIAAARENGLEPYVTSTLDGPWGIAAGLQVAAAEGIERHCGLATLELFDAKVATALRAPEGGRMTVPTGPGLGVELDEAVLDDVLVERSDLGNS
jgi:o-succinylbenzoate synthase